MARRIWWAVWVVVVAAALAAASLVVVAAPRDSWVQYGCDVVASSLDTRTLTDGQRFDVVIYGGTPSGVAAARAAAARGRSVLVVSAESTFGGAIANGLGATDVGNPSADIGYARAYLDSVRDFYGTNELRTEPKVAECLFERWLDSPRITAVRNAALSNVIISNDRITGVALRLASSGGNPIAATGSEFIDASYPGDLMAGAGVANRIGMGDLYSYGEPEARDRTLSTVLTIDSTDSPSSAAIAALPQVTQTANLDDIASVIERGMPSFTYRLCLTRNPSNVRPFVKGASVARYAPAWRLFMRHYEGFAQQTEAHVLANGTVVTQLWRIAKLPNDKVDLNAGPSSFTNFPMPSTYFTDPSTRGSILTDYRDYLESFLWFVQHDASVPAMERTALSGFGLCADEFTATNNWPPAVYLREGRRLVGVTTLTTFDLTTHRTKSDAIAFGGYAMDSKPSIVAWSNGRLVRDRGAMVPVSRYAVPLTAMIPASGPSNLLVSVGISASPLAYSSVRMEPQYIELGQAAGVAASLAIERGAPLDERIAPAVRQALGIH
jgi:hypothetical protein